jgi:hypothetical protein
MNFTLIQFRDSTGTRHVAASHDDGAFEIPGIQTTYELALEAIARSETLAQAVARRGRGNAVNLPEALDQGRLLAPIDHPDPAHCYLSGTGLTHLGSAEGRDAMHKAAAAGNPTDSMRMFLMGLEGGKPKNGGPGVQPEWFYKGDGSCIVGTGAPLTSPSFALDGGEEPEIAGIYAIGRDGTPFRLGICLANEFSDHVTERGNYLWLAHSKLRPAALGAELLTGTLPTDVRGTVRVLRDGAVLWQKAFFTGEANMTHTIDNLERHHFKYLPFRRPGDVHVHFFGTATLSFSDGVSTAPGDVFEITAPPFSLPLRNRLVREASTFDGVRAL